MNKLLNKQERSEMFQEMADCYNEIIKESHSYGDVIKLTNGKYSIVGMYKELTKKELQRIDPVASSEWLESLNPTSGEH